MKYCINIFQGLYIENYISDGAIHRTKIHCVTIDEVRYLLIKNCVIPNIYLIYVAIIGEYSRDFKIHKRTTVIIVKFQLALIERHSIVCVWVMNRQP